MIFKKQRSKDFIVGRACLFPSEILTLNDYKNKEYVHWIYILTGTILLEYSSKGEEHNNIPTDRLIDLREVKDSSFKITAQKQGCAFIMLMPADLNSPTEYSCLTIDIVNEHVIPLKETQQIVIPLSASMLVKKSSNSEYNKLPTTSVLKIDSNISATLKNLSHPMPSSVLLFSHK